MYLKTFIASVLIVAVAFSVALALENGAANIKIDAGKKKDVPFTHREHQEGLMDCMICHKLFPQEPNSIQTLKDQGKLKKKEIMKDLCIQCHKEMKKAGKEYGPTSCSQCHKG